MAKANSRLAVCRAEGRRGEGRRGCVQRRTPSRAQTVLGLCFLTFAAAQKPCCSLSPALSLLRPSPPCSWAQAPRMHLGEMDDGTSFQFTCSCDS